MAEEREIEVLQTPPRPAPDPETHPTDGRGNRLCIAVKKDGTPCRAFAVPGMTRCRNHGGMRVSGMDSPMFRHGRYSRECPAGLLEKYVQAENDPDLLSSRSDVALLQARIAELIDRLHGGESGSLWNDLQSEINRLGDGDSPDPEQMRLAFFAVRNLVRRGASQERQWRELKELIDQKTKVSAAEWKRLIDMRQVITAERVTVLCMSILDAVLKHIPEPERRSAVANDIHKLMTRKAPKGGETD